MTKRFIALLLALTLMFTFLGCSAEPKEKDAVDKYIEYVEKQENAINQFAGYKDETEISEDPLRILMDLEYVRGEPYDTSSLLNEFLYTLEASGQLYDVVIEYVPPHGLDRELMLDRIREELMSGGGPDVFIMNCGGMNLYPLMQSAPLFPFPEKAMEDGYFLPLDDLMENYTQYAEWDKQTQVVLEAGRNDEGQQIIPLAYTTDVIIYDEEDVPEFTADDRTTWMDIINDPVRSEIVRPMYDGSDMMLNEVTGEFIPIPNWFVSDYVFGKLADFAEEVLLFTEDEIFQRVKEICALSDTTKEVAPFGVELYPYALSDLGRESLAMKGGFLRKRGAAQDIGELFGSGPMRMIPVYSDDGGVTASIMSYAAVNRNTRRPTEAYTVIDLLMRDIVQRRYKLYAELILTYSSGISMNEGIMLEETEVGANSPWFTSEQRFSELCKIRQQITAANFESPLDIEMHQMFALCLQTYFDGGTDEAIKEIIHEYYERMEALLYE